MSTQKQYIVCNDHTPLSLGSNYPDAPEGDILVQSGEATVFDSLNDAKAAMHRTEEYARAHGLHKAWGPWPLHAVLLVGQPVAVSDV